MIYFKCFSNNLIFYKIFCYNFFYLIYVNIKRLLFVNLNANKKFKFNTMIYYIKKTWLQKTSTIFDKNMFKYNYLSKIIIKWILFLN